MIEGFTRYLSKDYGLMRDSIILLGGGLLANLLNYVFQLIVARRLGPEEYGIFSSLFALVYIAIMGAGVLNVMVTKYTAHFSARNEYGKIRTLFTRLSMRIFALGFVGLLAFILLSPYIGEFLRLESNYLVILVGIYGFVALFAPIYNGIFLGLQRFWTAAMLGVSGPLFKIIFLSFFLFMGLRLPAAFFAILAAQLAVTMLSIIPNLWLLSYRKQRVNKRDFVKYSVPVFIGTVVPFFYINADILLVKHYMDATLAGYYAAASLLAKLIFFGGGILSNALFPKISRLHAKQVATGNLLKGALFYTAVISLTGVLVYYTTPSFVVGLLYGREYKIAGLIGLFAVAITFFSLSNVLIRYNLAKERFGFVYLVIVAGILEISAIIAFHNTLIEVVKVLTITFGFLFVTLLLYTSKDLGFRFPTPTRI